MTPSDYYTSQMTQTKCGKIPPTPPGADINRNIYKAGWFLDPRWFYNQVRNKGPMDYKQQGPLYQDFGNFNYGATGAAFGFRDNLLQRAAGAANQIADPSRQDLGSPYGGPPYGDDPNDQTQIINGMEFCKCMQK
jgi:hypothetical protein